MNRDKPITIPAGDYPVSFIYYAALGLRLNAYTQTQLTEALAKTDDVYKLTEHMKTRVEAFYAAYKN